jgi:transposase
MMDEVGGVPMRVGPLSPLAQAPTAAGAAPVEAARPSGPEPAVAHLDEPRWRQGGKPAWLGGAVTRWVTVFLGRMSCGGDVAHALLGETFAGIVVTERSRASKGSPVRWRQGCWAHGRRDFAARRDRGGRAEELGEALLAQAHQMFPWWPQVCAGTRQRSTCRSSMRPLRREVARR